MAGAFALVLAAFGSAVVGNSADDNSLRADKYQTISQSYTGPNQLEPEVDVTRSMDRTKLTAQIQAQTAQKVAIDKKVTEAVGAEAKKLAQNLWVLPVTGYNLSARFGQRSGLWSTVHTGLDFAGPSGSTIVSVGAGVVKSTGFEGAYGNRTVITLNDGTDIWYCHQSRFGVQTGDVVAAGDPIGFTGSTGNVTGPHLHLEVHPNGGVAVDPYTQLVEHGVTP